MGCISTNTNEKIQGQKVAPHLKRPQTKATRDYLGYNQDEIVKSNLERGEKIKASFHVQCQAALGLWQDRVIFLTNLRLYHLQTVKKFDRQIRLERITGLTQSLDYGNRELVVHVHNLPDLRFRARSLEERNEIIDTLKQAYSTAFNQCLLQYGVCGGLADYTTTEKDLMNQIDTRKPSDSCLIRDVDMHEDFSRMLQTPKKAPVSVSASISSGSMSTGASVDSGHSKYSAPLDDGKPALFVRADDKATTLSDFAIKKMIGEGSYGKVYLIEKRDQPGHVYAMKVIEKHELLEDGIECAELEAQLLAESEHPFLMGMDYVFQTDNKLMFVMPFARGGELCQQIRRNQRLSEDDTRFYTAQLVQAIKHLHEKNVLYRDLKAENVLLGEDGYVLLTDFGLSKQLADKTEVTQSFCGTPDYMAPEMLGNIFNQKEEYGMVIDWWSIGILTYEMIVGRTPFYSKDAQTVWKLIRHKEVLFPREDHPEIQMSSECRDFIKKCLDKNPKTRLGSAEGASDLLEHPWLKKINQEQLLAKKLEAPFVPTKSVSDLTAYFYKGMVQAEAKLTPEPRMLISEESQKRLEEIFAAF